MEPIQGDLNAEGMRFAIIASRFNDDIVSELLAGAVECLTRHGATSESVDVYRVPGAFEIPVLAARLVDLRRYDAIVTVGALIRGETPHFDFISQQTTMEISRVAVDSKTPIAFGVVTCNTMEQAKARTIRGSNKGWEAALAAIEMANLFRGIR
ncbi:MAG: 6,7-dimethyl-8-ribityllumazine synthase [Thermoanaerobaculia bacterium]